MYIRINEESRIIFYNSDPGYQPGSDDILVKDYEVPLKKEGQQYKEFYCDGKVVTVYEPLPLSIEDQLAAAMEENKELKQRQDLAEEALLQLSDMILTK